MLQIEYFTCEKVFSCPGRTSRELLSLKDSKSPVLLEEDRLKWVPNQGSASRIVGKSLLWQRNSRLLPGLAVATVQSGRSSESTDSLVV